MKRKFKLAIIYFITTIALSNNVLAQGLGDPGCDPADPTCVPIDNGVLILIFTVIAISLKKAYDYKKAIV